MIPAFSAFFQTVTNGIRDYASSGTLPGKRGITRASALVLHTRASALVLHTRASALVLYTRASALVLYTRASALVLYTRASALVLYTRALALAQRGQQDYSRAKDVIL